MAAVLTASTAADPSATVRGRGRTAAAWWPMLAAPAVGLYALVVGYAGAGVPSYWGDEAASVLSATRSWPSLWAELGRVDAVHGVYYSLLHLWVGAFGTGEWATRALSAIGIAALAAGVVVLGRAWFGTRTAVAAGLIVPLIPRASLLAVETRGYALAAAAAVWLTVLFAGILRGAGRPARRRARWIGYAVATAAAGYLFLYLLLVPLAHMVALLVARRWRTLWAWAAAMTATIVLVLPLLVVAFVQRGQLSFLAHRGYLTPDGVLVRQWFGHPAAAIAMWALVLVGVAATLRSWRRGGSGTVPSILLAWLVLPAAALICLDLLVAPTYNPRYTSVSLGAVALLMAAGARALLGLVRARAARLAAGALIALVLVGVAAPEYLQQRTEFAKDGGADFRATADYVGANAARGDTVLFGTTGRPSRAPDLGYRLYPDRFAGLQRPQLRTPYDRTAGLWDVLAGVPEVAGSLLGGTVWLVEQGEGTGQADLDALASAGYRQTGQERVHRSVVYELQKGGQP